MRSVVKPRAIFFRSFFYISGFSLAWCRFTLISLVAPQDTMTFQKSLVPRAVVFGFVASAVLAAPQHHPNEQGHAAMILVPHRNFLPSDFKSYGDWAVAEMSAPYRTLDADNEQRRSWMATKGLLPGIWRSLMRNGKVLTQPQLSPFGAPGAPIQPLNTAGPDPNEHDCQEEDEGIDEVIEVKFGLEMEVPEGVDEAEIRFDVKLPHDKNRLSLHIPQPQQHGGSIPPELEEAIKSIERASNRHSAWYKAGYTREPELAYF